MVKLQVMPDLEMRSVVEDEIRRHPEWCSPDCRTFMPDDYRQARLFYGLSAKFVQKKDPRLCHTSSKTTQRDSR